MEGQQSCDDHPNKPLTLQCVPCDKLICALCKKTGHTHHATRSTHNAAEDIRYQLLTKLHDLRGPTTNARAAVKKKRSSQKSFEESVQETKEAIRDRAEAVISYINQVVREKLRSVDDFAERNGRTELCSHVSELEEHLNALKTNTQAVKRLLANDVSDLEVIQQWSFVSTPPAPPVFAIPVHQTYLFLPKVNDQWKDQIQSMLGLPKVAQTSTQSSAMAVAHRLNVLKTVQALHVMKDGRLCVALVPAALPENSAVHDSLVLHVYNPDGTLFLRKTIEGCKRPRLSSTPNSKIVVLCAFSGTKTIFDVGPWSSETEQTDPLCDFLCCFKMDSHKIARRKLALKTEKRTIYEVSSESTKPLFTVLTENPQTVVADKAGEYFAVIQLTVNLKTSDTPKKAEKSVKQVIQDSAAAVFKRAPNTSDTPTKAEAPLKQVFQGSVAVFKRPSESTSKAQKPFTTFSPHANKAAYPAAVCFDKNSSNQNVLLVAQGATIYMVDYENTGNPITSVSGECPVLTTPTALTTDSEGRLWIGCQDGNILNWVHMEEVSEHYYMQPEDVEERDGDVSSDSEDGVGTDDGDVYVKTVGASALTSTSVHITSSSGATLSAPILKRNRFESEKSHIYVEVEVDNESSTQAANSSVNGESASGSVLHTPVTVDTSTRKTSPGAADSEKHKDCVELVQECTSDLTNTSALHPLSVEEKNSNDSEEVSVLSTSSSGNTSLNSDTDLYTYCRTSNINVSPEGETTDGHDVTAKSKRTGNAKGASDLYTDCRSSNFKDSQGGEPTDRPKVTVQSKPTGNMPLNNESDVFTDCQTSNFKVSREAEPSDRPGITNNSKPTGIPLDLHSKIHSTADSAEPECTAKNANLYAEETRKAATAQRLMDEEASSMNADGSKEFNREEDDSESPVSLPVSDTMSNGSTSPHSDGSKTAGQNSPSRPVPRPPPPNRPVPPPPHPHPRRARRPCPLPPVDEFSSQTTADLTGEHTKDKHRQLKPLTGCGGADDSVTRNPGCPNHENSDHPAGDNSGRIQTHLWGPHMPNQRDSKPRPPPPPPPKPRRAASMENLLENIDWQ
ncbi:uncharacterized protein [Littorina saxatilis]|uniref:B box-type domain-containing protein n=1 Tax=Littorina saxatilis TaxID=31220 RepID=A0AAN9BNK7_9CAEN